MKYFSQRGLTVIGVLIATIVISVVGIGAAQLLTRSERIAEVASTQFVATNLAREGLELVRVVRDTSWFQNSERSQWIPEDMCGDFVYDAAAARDGSNALSTDVEKLYINESTHEWKQAAAGSGDSGYTRVMNIDCSEKDSETPFVTVTSTVTWAVRGEERSVVIKEKLFNWLPPAV